MPSSRNSFLFSNSFNKYIDKLKMITHYNTIRQAYIVDGYDEALKIIQQLQKQTLSETLLTNLYCYITIQAEFKPFQILNILNQCLNEQGCKLSLRALTLYHIASVHFKQKNLQQCKISCQQIVNQFLGYFYSLQMRLEKSNEQEAIKQQIQQILYYVFLMQSYICKKEKRLDQSNLLLEAGRRLIKDRKNVFSLTTKTALSRDQSYLQERNTSVSIKSDGFNRKQQKK